MSTGPAVSNLRLAATTRTASQRDEGYSPQRTWAYARLTKPLLRALGAASRITHEAKEGERHCVLGQRRA